MSKMGKIHTIVMAIFVTAGLVGIIASYYFIIQPAESPNQSPSNTVMLTGAGASFPYPLLNSVITNYVHEIKTNVQVNYQAIGSGGGISALKGKTVDFAGSDAPLRTADAIEIPTALHIPETIGAVTVAYNLPDVPTGLHLTGKVIADIFQGITTKWNDPTIQKLNTDVILPDSDILVVHRSDSSGTTFIFTGYLATVSSSWDKEVGQGKAVAWPIGIGSSGNTGVASVIQGQSYTIGYVELSYTLQSGMKTAAIQNPEGNYVTPTLESTTKAAQLVASIGLPAGDQSWTNVNIINAQDAQAYPIVSFSYLLVYKELNIVPGMTKTKAAELVQFLWYLVHDGQQLASELDYAPLPTNVIQLNEATIQSISFNGQQLSTSSK